MNNAHSPSVVTGPVGHSSGNDHPIWRFVGLRELGLAQSALASPRQTMFGTELYHDFAAKAAILFFLLIKNHPFVDGNKRTAFMAMLRFVEMNGYTFEATENDLFDVTIHIATGDLDKDATTAWVRDHLRPLASD